MTLLPLDQQSENTENRTCPLCFEEVSTFAYSYRSKEKRYYHLKCSVEIQEYNLLKLITEVVPLQVEMFIEQNKEKMIGKVWHSLWFLHYDIDSLSILSLVQRRKGSFLTHRQIQIVNLHIKHQYLNQMKDRGFHNKD